MKRRLAALVTSLGLIAAAGAMAQTVDHSSHATPPGGVLELTLNQGAKWQGDESMYRGMEGIRDAVLAREAAIHDGSLDPQARKALAAEIMGQVDYMVANCKLSPETDEQLHMVLGQVIEGASALEGDGPVEDGAVLIVAALEAYGTHFEHPGWTGLN